MNRDSVNIVANVLLLMEMLKSDHLRENKANKEVVKTNNFYLYKRVILTNLKTGLNLIIMSHTTLHK